MTNDLIGNGCVFINNPDIPIQGLGGYNKLTNSCNTWLNGSNFLYPTNLIPGGGTRKLIYHKLASAAPYGSNNFENLGSHSGIFFSLDNPYLKNNLFYQVRFDMEQILPYECTSISESGQEVNRPGAPTISVYSKVVTDNEPIEFLGNDAVHNEIVRVNDADFLGSFTTNGMEVGNYTSPTFKFFYLNEIVDNSFFQLAFFNFGNDAGLCDDPPLPPPSGQGTQNAEMYTAALMSNIVFDCDNDNIRFDATIEQHELNGHPSCTQQIYVVKLSTECPNIDFNDFPFTINVANNLGNSKSFQGNGEITYIDLSDLPAGNYTLGINYDNSSGKNIKVEQYGFQPFILFNHSLLNSFSINTTYIIDQPTWVPKNIVIESGGTLIVRGDMLFKELTSITVSTGGTLLLENQGQLSSCGAQWLGVFVGTNSIANIHGTVRNSYYGIHNEDKGNGIINCDGAQFIDNRIGVNVRYEGIATVRNSQFIGGVYGASLFECTGGTTPNGVLFEGNTFSYQTDAGIASLNTPINVRNGNQFIGCAEGIAMRNLFGSNSESRIGGSGFDASNVFSNCTVGVYANANTQTLQNNVFSNCNNGTFMSGVNSYESFTNSFTGGYNAEGLFSAGAQSNISERNDHSGSVYGIRTYFDNDNYTFLANCFYSAGTDVESFGTISGAQGDDAVAASNCFTDANFVEDFVCNTSNNVIYFVPKPTVSYPVCFDPHFAGNYTIDHADNFYTIACGTTLANPPIGEYDYIKILGCDSLGIFTLIDQYRKRLKKYQITPTTPWTAKELAEIAWLNRHLRYLYNQWAWCLRKQGRKQALYDWYKSLDGKDYAINAVEVKIWMQQYNAAIAELLEIQNTYNINASVIDAMLLNIAYVRTDADPLVPNQAQLNLLRAVSAIPDPYAAYGRVLLYHLTGEKIEPPLPEVTPRSRPESVQPPAIETYNISPNPTADFINIDISNRDVNAMYSCEIIGLSGVNVASSLLVAGESMNVAHLASGFYMAKVRKNQEVVSVQKIIISK